MKKNKVRINKKLLKMGIKEVEGDKADPEEAAREAEQEMMLYQAKRKSRAKPKFDLEKDEQKMYDTSDSDASEMMQHEEKSNYASATNEDEEENNDNNFGNCEEGGSMLGESNDLLSENNYNNCNNN
jgi:hypothetical protein